MKIYKCKICKFSGIKQDVRKHLREEHNIRGKAKNVDDKILPSQLTKNTIAEEI